MRTACVGQYSMTEAGGGWYEDPHDYYTPQLIAKRLSQESGNMTRTTTFYGICFDYAQFAYNYVKLYSDCYRSQGMRENQYWIAGTDENPNQIELQYPGDRNNFTVIQNGVYVKRPDNNPFRNVKTHKKLNGSRATHHAWIWIQRSDGVQFWVDPTWTDNLGYVVYGYVYNGEEIQCRPSRDYCVTYPNYLNNLPLPPSYGNTMPPSSTANSTNPEETIKDASPGLIGFLKDSITRNEDPGWLLGVGFHIPLESPFQSKNMGFSIGYESVPQTADTYHNLIFMDQIDFYIFDGHGALLVDLNLGYEFGPNFYKLGIYGGGGIGFSVKDSSYSFAYQWNAGVRTMIKRISFRGEISYLNKLGYMLGTYISFRMF